MKKKICAVLSVTLSACMFCSISSVVTSAEDAGSYTGTTTVYQQCISESHYLDENGIFVHEYTWTDPIDGAVSNESTTSIMSNLDNATWKTTNLDDGTVVKHRSAKEYENGGTKWYASAETTAYRQGNGVYNKTTARIVNFLFGNVVSEGQSQWTIGSSSAITPDSALSNEPTLVLRSYWSTQ